MIRVLTVFGTRPEAIKLAPVIKVLSSRPEHFESRVCVTAQHREMLDQAMRTMDVSPDFDLDVMRQAQSPSAVAAAVFDRLPGVLERVRPHLMLVQGDTTTTFAASMVAYLNRIPVGHIEAGLRTGNLDQPFPEEMNRILTSRVATLHFAPTSRARDALLAEGVNPSNTYVTGNTVIDALLSTVADDYTFADSDLRRLRDRDPIVLITTHRRESFGRPLQNICDALIALAESRPDHQFVLPVHPNPTVSTPIHERLGELPNITLCQPLAYPDFVNLMARARIILTDSGGIQEEAPSLDVPLLVMRETTERQEIVDAGGAKLVGTSVNAIVRSANELLNSDTIYRRMANAENPFGDGNASRRIADILMKRMGASTASAQS